MVKQDCRPICNVVFVVEATANVGAYFDGLKSAYVLPTLEYVYTYFVWFVLSVAWNSKKAAML